MASLSLQQPGCSMAAIAREVAAAELRETAALQRQAANPRGEQVDAGLNR